MDKKRYPSRHELHAIRKVWHAVSGTAIALVYYYFMSKQTASIIFAIACIGFGIFEVGRTRFDAVAKIGLKIFGPFLRVHEVKQISGSFYFLLGTTLATIIYSKPVTVLAVLYLSLADPVASAFGITFATPNLRVKSSTNNKSLFGTLMACVLSFSISYFFLIQEFPLIPIGSLIIISIIGGISAGLAELSVPVVFPIDDNFIIPMVCGGVLQILFYIFL
eukprot:TRINITY_DN1607_c0_g1_i1.p1 TRINITY_DN1607_c0_g1~~TRINITY_DN1607_c0_g1_i1.p1  ORF type:complete len:220 (+),score=19.72 TRINITY_DN1607_c0_g1_i1:73-732(+)